MKSFEIKYPFIKNPWIIKIAWFLMICSTIWIIIFLPASIIINTKQFYLASFNTMYLPKGLDLNEAYLNYGVLIDYLQLGNSNELNFPNYKMSNEGKIHFEEVKQILSNIWIILILACFIFIITLPILIINKKFSFLLISPLIVLAFFILVLIIFLINPEGLFVLMHKILFNNDFWIFDPTKDEIIKALPMMFFFNVGFAIMGTAAIIMISLITTYIILKKKIQKN